MTATVYNRGQMVIPVKARKQAGINQGDVLLVEPEGDGRIVLVRLERPKAREPQKARLVARKGTHPVIVGGRKVSEQELREALADFPHKAEFIPDDIPALKSRAPKSDDVTDCYLAELASTKGLKLATLDTGITHAAAELIT